MAYAATVGYEGFGRGLLTLLAEPPRSKHEDRLESLVAHVKEVLPLLVNLSNLTYELKPGSAPKAEQKRHLAAAEVMQGLIHSLEGDDDLQLPSELSDLQREFDDARAKALARLRDFRLALLFIIDEPSDDADAAFALEYPPSQPPQPSAPLDLD